MKKWIPFFVLTCMALLSSAATVIIGIEAYLAVTGLDLLVMAKKTAPRIAVILAIVSILLWLISFIVLFITKPYKRIEAV